MTRVPLAALAFCLALSPAAIPMGAKADPKVLTAPELAAVTAGRVVLPPIQLNLNATAQVANATAISIAVCAACGRANVAAISQAAAFNINAARLTNRAF